MSFGLYIVGYINIDYRPCDRCPLAARAPEVDRSRCSLSDRHSDHSRGDGDSTEGSAILAVIRRVHRPGICPMANRPVGAHAPVL